MHWQTDGQMERQAGVWTDDRWKDRQKKHCLTYLYMHVKCKNTSHTRGILFEVLSPAASSFWIRASRTWIVISFVCSSLNILSTSICPIQPSEDASTLTNSSNKCNTSIDVGRSLGLSLRQRVAIVSRGWSCPSWSDRRDKMGLRRSTSKLVVWGETDFGWSSIGRAWARVCRVRWPNENMSSLAS